MKLVRIVKNWEKPDLLRQTPGNDGVWGGVRFTLDPVVGCDYLVFLNNLMTNVVHARCAPENIWAIMQEPYMKGHSDWLVEKHDFFAKVFTHHPPTPGTKYVVSHPALPWYVDKTYDQLTSMTPPSKTKKLSWVVGNANDLPGHAKRYALLKTLQDERSLNIDLFGRAVCSVDDKWDALAPYQYSLAVENSSSSDYWTEKIADCYLAWAVPIYYGCSNLEKYFPKESFIWIDINNPSSCITKIKTILDSDDYEKRLHALREARDLVLNRYQIFPFLSGLIKSRTGPQSDARDFFIPPYKRSIKAKFYRRAYKIRKKLNLLV